MQLSLLLPSYQLASLPASAKTLHACAGCGFTLALALSPVAASPAAAFRQRHTREWHACERDACEWDACERDRQALQTEKEPALISFAPAS